MDKIDIKLVSETNVKFDFQDQMVIVNPWISLENKYTLLNNYLETLNNNEYDNIRKYIESEYALKLGMIELQTNISIQDITIDAVINSGLYDKIVSNIKNYNEIREDIAEIVKRENGSRSTSIAFSKMTDKVIETLNKIGDIDLSEKAVSELLSAFGKEKEKLEEYFPVVKNVKMPVKKHTKKEDPIL